MIMKEDVIDLNEDSNLAIVDDRVSESDRILSEVNILPVNALTDRD